MFLISLKAGETELNLTAADCVIYYDPWWNPAVEMRAADRTHRIGQTKHVFSYKLITKETIEERVLLLQEKKKHLVSTVITTDSGFMKALTKEDMEALSADNNRGGREVNRSVNNGTFKWIRRDPGTLEKGGSGV